SSVRALEAPQAMVANDPGTSEQPESNHKMMPHLINRLLHRFKSYLALEAGGAMSHTVEVFDLELDVKNGQDERQVAERLVAKLNRHGD
ncbi:hypothetical protein SARC_10850, partial [Sphaeroforma arctica JP610]